MPVSLNLSHRTICFQKTDIFIVATKRICNREAKKLLSLHFINRSTMLPDPFILSIRSLLRDETEPFLSSVKGPAPVSIRLNPLKTARNPLAFALPVQPVAWSEWGCYLDERPAFTFDPLFHSGYYYVQEASSMFLEYLVRQVTEEPVICLDLCGAPGGKSLSLLSALPEGSLLVSNEVVRQRSHVLAETLRKSGYPNVMVTNNEAVDFATIPSSFDLILVDAPCSGEGMFRKDETAIMEWSPRNVTRCAVRQKDILRDVWPALKPGGLLLYSTCTYNTAENEENALWTVRQLGAEFAEVAFDPEWGITPACYPEVKGYRFFPHKTRGEGLFVTVLRKTTTAEAATPFLSGKHKKRRATPFLKDISPYSHLLHHSDRFNFMEDRSQILALPSCHSETILSLAERLHPVTMGVGLGEWKGRDFIPSHPLAMSLELQATAFHRHEVSWEEAIAYLRNEVISLTDTPKGFVLLTYLGEPLGFVKNVGSRANNLYPAAWRIRSGYQPDAKPELFRQMSRSADP